MYLSWFNGSRNKDFQYGALCNAWGNVFLYQTALVFLPDISKITTTALTTTDRSMFCVLK